MPPRTTKRRTTTNIKTKKQPELPENQTVWKSDNQEVKEETFLQTGRGVEMGSQAERMLRKAVTGGLGEVVAGRADGPTFACR